LNKRKKKTKKEIKLHGEDGRLLSLKEKAVESHWEKHVPRKRGWEPKGGGGPNPPK